MAKKKYVTASDIGRVAFCPRSVSLEKQGRKVTANAQQRRHRGNAAHEQFNKEMKAKQGKRCFIATATLGENHPVTQDFRNYRDSNLNSQTGKVFIALYYAVSPSVCVVLNAFPALKKPVRALLFRIHKRWMHKS